jgi:hypothetical protein
MDALTDEKLGTLYSILLYTATEQSGRLTPLKLQRIFTLRGIRQKPKPILPSEQYRTRIATKAKAIPGKSAAVRRASV